MLIDKICDHFTDQTIIPAIVIYDGLTRDKVSDQFKKYFLGNWCKTKLCYDIDIPNAYKTNLWFYDINKYYQQSGIDGLKSDKV